MPELNGLEATAQITRESPWIKVITDPPVYLFADALFWESRHIVQTWQYRWEEQMFL